MTEALMEELKEGPIRTWEFLLRIANGRTVIDDLSQYELALLLDKEPRPIAIRTYLSHLNYLEERGYVDVIPGKNRCKSQITLLHGRDMQHKLKNKDITFKHLQALADEDGRITKLNQHDIVKKFLRKGYSLDINTLGRHLKLLEADGRVEITRCGWMQTTHYALRTQDAI